VHGKNVWDVYLLRQVECFRCPRNVRENEITINSYWQSDNSVYYETKTNGVRCRLQVSYLRHIQPTPACKSRSPIEMSEDMCEDLSKPLYWGPRLTYILRLVRCQKTCRIQSNLRWLVLLITGLTTFLQILSLWKCPSVSRALQTYTICVNIHQTMTDQGKSNLRSENIMCSNKCRRFHHPLKKPYNIYLRLVEISDQQVLRVRPTCSMRWTALVLLGSIIGSRALEPRRTRK